MATSTVDPYSEEDDRYPNHWDISLSYSPEYITAHVRKLSEQRTYDFRLWTSGDLYYNGKVVGNLYAIEKNLRSKNNNTLLVKSRVDLMNWCIHYLVKYWDV